MRDTQDRVVVVGAGFAGLSAALALHDAGVPVRVIEARERVGGRVWSTTLTNGAVVELGAEWIQEDDAAVHELARRFDVSVVEAGTDYRRREPWGPSSAPLEDQDAFLAAARSARAALTAEAARRMTLGQFLEGVAGDDDARRLVMARLAGTCAQDLHEVALRVADGERALAALPGGRYFRMGPGNHALASAMADALPEVRLGAAVEAIHHDDASVTVRAGDRDDPAAAAIVAVPAPIAARLTFVPALPETVASALRELPMGVAAKFAVATKDRPSVRSRQSSSTSMWCWAGTGDGDRTRRCVTSFAGSPAAQRDLGITEGRVGPWLDALRAMNPDLTFDGEPVMYAWGDDPYTLGSYVAFDNASWDRIDRLSDAHGRIAFAGEHTAGPDHHGTMNGALLSGRRAAEQVLERLR
jgi:monoamine oxidase